MADLVGSATIRVTADTTAARRDILGLQRLSPIRIVARVDAPTASITAATAALRDLRNEADDTARALGQLSRRALTAAAALRIMGSQTHRLRSGLDDLDDSIRRLGSSTATLTGSLTTIRGATSSTAGAVDELRSGALLLAPALIPIAAQAAPIAAGLGAAAVAVGAFAAAAAGQVSALSDAAEAETKYNEAIKEHGTGSKEAGQAQLAYARTVADMPAPTRRAAAALSSLKEQYREWSDSLAGDTMPVATRALETFSAVFPKLTPLVQGSSTQLNRFLTLVQGGIASPGFDRVSAQFSDFATRVMRHANDALVQFTRTLDTGQVGGGVSAFLEYARANGPLVRDTFSKLGEALANLLEGAANVGPGLLTIVNALAGLVAAVPPEVVTTMLQLAVAVKAVSAAAALAAAAQLRLAAFGTSITAMTTAASGATGVLPRLGAAIGALSRTAKVAIAGTGIGLLVIALSELSQRGRDTPPDVDKLTSSLQRLGSTGKVAGEAARAFGDDLGGLYDKVRSLTDPSTTDQVQQFLVGWTGWDSTPVKEAKENLDSVDKALAEMVSNGQADLAAAALKRLTAEYGKGGRDTSEFTKNLDDYKTALENAKFEQQLAAQAMGAFGEQAQATSAKLAAQKVDADGLREALIALNDVNRSAYDSQINFEASLDALTKSFKDNGATLDLNTKAGQENGRAMSAAAKARDELIANGVAANESLSSMTGKSDRLRESMLKLATQAFDGNKKKAQEYINTLLGTPAEIKTLIKAERANAIAGLQQVQAEIKKTPNAKSVKVTTLNAAAIKALEDVGYKTRTLKDGRTEVYTANGQAIGSIKAVSNALNRLNGKNASTTTTNTIVTNYVTNYLQGRSQHDITGATGGQYTGTGFKHRGYAVGGMVDGPGTGTSDSVFAPWLSKGEFVINARRTRQYLPLLRSINEGRLHAGGTNSAAGSGSEGNLAQAVVSMMRGTLNAAAERARALAASAVSAISRDIGRGLVAGLQAAAPKVAAAAKQVIAPRQAAGVTVKTTSSSPKTGFAAAVSELQQLVDTGRWTRKGSTLFEDISFQGMSRNFAAQQMKVADGFWAAVNDIQKAVRAGKRVFEDMTYKGMSANVSRFHDMIAQIWKGNPYGRTFGDWGNFGTYGRYGKYAAGGLITGPGSGTADRVPILASNREYIVNARQTSRNLPLLNAINSGQVTATSRTGTASASLGDTNITVVVQNHGVIGSQMQMQDWLAKSLDNLTRTGRLPTSLRKAVAA